MHVNKVSRAGLPISIYNKMEWGRGKNPEPHPFISIRSFTSIMKLRLDYALFSERQLQIASDNNFNGHDMRLATYLQMNHNTNTTKVFREKPKQIADQLGCHPSFIYAAMHKMNKSGYATLAIKNKKLTGRLNHTAKKLFRELENSEKQDSAQEHLDLGLEDKLFAAMIHKNAIELLMRAKLTPCQMLLAFHLPLNCSLKTGELDEIRPRFLAEKIGCHETTVIRGP